MDIDHNLELGLEGEQLVSGILEGLGAWHEHHSFNSIQEYSESQGSGPDCWSGIFQIEVKHFPNSKLTSQSHYDILIKNRWLPDIEIKIVVQIKGRTVGEFRHICNRDKTVFIYVENEKYLKSKLEYWLKRLKVLPDIELSNKDVHIVIYAPYTTGTDNYPTIDEFNRVLSYFDYKNGKGPPGLAQNHANLGSSVSLGYVFNGIGGVIDLFFRPLQRSSPFHQIEMI